MSILLSFEKYTRQLKFDFSEVREKFSILVGS
jgi:hypothetical protein